MQDNLQLWWQQDAEDGVVLCRAFGTEPVVKIPEKIGDYKITAIGAYCFSDRNRVPEDGIRVFFSQDSSSNVRELSGDFIEKVVLPSSIRRIDNAAFFNCRKLKCIEIGNESLTIGSDVFNNCSRLKETVVRGSVREPSGAKQILDRISWDMKVTFEDAAILYPEYYESYDAIAPAHIFGLSIEGEGFRARQCFRGDMVDFPAYDDIFGKACAEENVETLAEMSLNRLISPIDLSEDKKAAYERYLQQNDRKILEVLVRKKEQDRLEFMCQNRYTDGEALDIALQEAVSENWSEGAVSLLEWKQKYFGADKKRRYDFI